MKSKELKNNKSKKIVKKTESDLMIEYLEDQLKSDMRRVAWLKRDLSEAKEKVVQNRKILEKLKII